MTDIMFFILSMISFLCAWVFWIEWKYNDHAVVFFTLFLILGFTTGYYIIERLYFG